MSCSYKRFASLRFIYSHFANSCQLRNAAYKSDRQFADLRQVRLTPPPEMSVRWIKQRTRRHHLNSSQCTVESSTNSIKHESIMRRGGVAPRILWQARTWSASHPHRGKTSPRWVLGPFRTLWGKEKCPAPTGNWNTVPRVSILPDFTSS